MTHLLIRDAQLCKDMIRERKRRGIDRYDEVWEGIYIVFSPPTNAQQALVSDLGSIFHQVANNEGTGETFPGVNVSDRRKGWERNFRCPDVAVVLNDSKAVDCNTHFYLGPDFLVEVESPGDDTEEKVPFYGKVGVRELLIIHRDKRTLRLLRHDGHELVLVQPDGKQWLHSEVLPLAFRCVTSKGTNRTEVRRTDGKPGRWTLKLLLSG